MKKSTIWTIAVIMGVSFLALLFLQFSYVEEMVKMKKEQFDESVARSLYQASRNLEMNETLRYLEKDVNETERRAFTQDSIIVDGLGSVTHSHQFAVAADDGTIYSSFQVKALKMKPASVPKAMILRKDKNSLADATKTMQEIVRQRYVYQKALLDEVVYNILYTASEKPLKERVNFRMLDKDIRVELMNNGINIPYHFTVSTTDGREVYRCPDYEEEGKEYTYEQKLFSHDPQSKMGVVRIHFPEMNSYIFSSVRFMIPSIIFTIVLLITFLFTIVVIFRQKRYTEIKNDFINNYLRSPLEYHQTGYVENHGNENISFGSDVLFTANTGIRLPPNLSLLATMNTSDQNVFTLDNAFQRRWDMLLVKNKCDDTKQMDATISVNGQTVTWKNFQQTINAVIGEKSNESGLSSMEDKRLGCWFVKAENKTISKEVFANKVLKYLWDDAFKFCHQEIFGENCCGRQTIIPL